MPKSRLIAQRSQQRRATVKPDENLSPWSSRRDHAWGDLTRAYLLREVARHEVAVERAQRRLLV
jgi:hypothetical protein